MDVVEHYDLKQQNQYAEAYSLENVCCHFFPYVLLLIGTYSHRVLRRMDNLQLLLHRSIVYDAHIAKIGEICRQADLDSIRQSVRRIEGAYHSSDADALWEYR